MGTGTCVSWGPHPGSQGLARAWPPGFRNCLSKGRTGASSSAFRAACSLSSGDDGGAVSLRDCDLVVFAHGMILVCVLFLFLKNFSKSCFEPN